MQAPSDAELLADYATRRSEAAFARLVERYIAMVHSAARRQVSDPHLAEEITQAVFILLARKAGSLARQTVLSGWLCRTAHFAARDALRAERRRLHREQLAAHMDTTPDAAWQQLAPLLDEAVAQLREADRNAIVLRYYEQRSLDETGAALGIGADAAQKRVARALEKLRAIFTKRGVTLTGAAIAGAVSANAVQAVPVGLAAKISAAAILAGTTIATTTAIVMTTLQKTLITATLAAAVGAGIYEARQASNARAEVQALKQQQAPLVEQTLQLTRERDDATNRLGSLTDENERLKHNTLEVMRLRSEVTRLREEWRAMSETNVDDRSVANTNSLEQILKILWDDDATEAGGERRFNAAQQLRHMGAQALQGLPAFRELLRSGKQETSYAGACALAFTAEACPEAFQELRNGLSDPDAKVRDAATYGVTLVFGGQAQNEYKDLDADSTLATLVKNLRDASPVIRADTASAIEKYVEKQQRLGKTAEEELVIPVLMQNLEDPSSWVRLNAVWCLDQYGDAAKAAIPQLTKLLQDSDSQVQGAARSALQRVSKVRATLNQ